MSARAHPNATALLAVVPLLLPVMAAHAAALQVEPLPVPSPAGSRSPNLAAGGGRLVLSWIEPAEDGHRLSFSVLGDDRWSGPRTVARGDNWFVNWADFPSVVPIDGPLWAAHWLVRQPAGGYAYDVLLSISQNAGDTWSEPMMPHDDGTPTEHGFVTLYEQDGDVALVWLDGRNTAGAGHGANGAGGGMTLRHASFADDLRNTVNAEIDDLVCDCCATDVAVAESGPIAVYRDRTTKEVRDIYVMRQVGGAWQPPRPVAPDGWVIEGCPVNGPVIAADGTTVAVAWFTATNDRPSVRLARSGDSGESFGEPIEIAAGETFGRAGIALLPDGEVAVTWLCKNSGMSADVCLRSVGADDIPGPVIRISGEHGVPSLNVPQLVRHGDDLVAAWTERIDGQTAVKAVRIRLEDARGR